MNQSRSSRPAVLLIGHGTRLAAGVAEFRSLAEQLQQALPDRACLAGFSGTGRTQRARGAGNAVATRFPPYHRSAGVADGRGYIKNDILALINAFRPNTRR
ncbi:MAG: hypothetical protein U1F42_06580 [Candidatus Competibacteraceae bacterium]